MVLLGGLGPEVVRPAVHAANATEQIKKLMSVFITLRRMLGSARFLSLRKRSQDRDHEGGGRRCMEANAGIDNHHNNGHAPIIPDESND
jgi:hypothetical protein